MLAFGVVAGSLVKPAAESLARTYIVAMPPAATAPAATPASDSGSSSSAAAAAAGHPRRRVRVRFVALQRSHAVGGHGCARPAAPTRAAAIKGTGDGGGGGGILGLPPVKHVFLIVLSDQGYANTFSPVSTDRYLSKTLPKQGELINNYYAVAGSPLANDIALISGQGPTPQTASNCPTFSLVSPGSIGMPARFSATAASIPPAHTRWRTS